MTTTTRSPAKTATADESVVSEEDGAWIGMDFGTTHSTASVWSTSRGAPKWMRLLGIAAPLRSKPGRLVPSILAFCVPSQSQRLSMTKITTVAPGLEWGVAVGHEVEQAQTRNETAESDSYSPEAWSKATVSNFKRALGGGYNQSNGDTRYKESGQVVMVQITPLGSDESVWIPVHSLVTILLTHMRQECDDYLVKNIRKKRLEIPGSLPVKHVVLGVPATWTSQNRRTLQQAALKAGFSSASLLTESTAAAMAYGLATSTTGLSRILVFDMGGGTTDVTIAVRTATSPEYKVQVTAGHGRLGGHDMDQALGEFVLRKVQDQLGSSSLELTPAQQDALLHQCRKAKEALCGSDKDEAVETATIRLQGCTVTLSATDLNTCIAPILKQAQELLQEALTRYDSMEGSSGLMDEVLLIGGATRVPAVRDLLRKTFPHISELCTTVNAESAVSQGAAIQAAMQSGQVPLHLIRSALMLDTTPHALGVLVEEGNRFVELVAAGTSLPATGSTTFTLADSSQPGVSIRAVECVGLEEFVPLGDFTFLLHRVPTPPLTRSVEIGFKLTLDGAFYVSIYDALDPEHQAGVQATKTSRRKGNLTAFQIKTTWDGNKLHCCWDVEPLDPLHLCQDFVPRGKGGGTLTVRCETHSLEGLSDLQGRINTCGQKDMITTVLLLCGRSLRSSP